MSGVFFVGALGSRISLLPGILILCGVGFVQVLRDDHGNGKVLITFVHRYSSYFGLIFFGLILLGWYNYARFGSIFEFGHRYQLTYWGIENPYDDLFSWRNILPNLYNYFLNGFRRLNVFPFIKPIWGKSGLPAIRATAGATYRAEQVTGILVSSPLIIIGCIPIYNALRRVWTRLDEPINRFSIKISDFNLLDINIIYTGMLIITVALLLPFLLISFNSMRYLFDFSFSASIMAAIGIGLTLRADNISMILKGIIVLLVIVFSLYSSLVGILLGITSYSARF
ncbi:hypothetical protein KA005_56475, partial [bacterium]|nr:hypothetical protein [bacterium]